MTTNEKLIHIIKYFGFPNQVLKLKEEIDEVIEAMEDIDKKHITEELADVLVVLNQFKLFFHIEDKDLIEMMEYKIDRTLDRIEEGYYEK